MGPLLIFFFYGYLSTVFTFLLTKKAGIPPSKMFIPFYNTYLLTKLVEKPPYWTALCYLPVTNVFIVLSIYVELVKAFDKYDLKPQLLSMLFPFIYLPLLGKEKDLVFKGVNKKKLKKSFWREWVEAIAFAVIAATIIRWSTMEAFTIPTASMEGSLLEGDFLFVSKMHYGTRSPITPLQVPLTHRYFWGTANEQGHDGVKSFSSLLQLPYFRLPGLSNVENNNIVVFNYPAEVEPFDSFRDKTLGSDVPIDLRNNYVKRCVAIHGDSIKSSKGQVFINNDEIEYFEDQQTGYFVKYPVSILSQQHYASTITKILNTCRDKGIELSKSDCSLLPENSQYEFINKTYKHKFKTPNAYNFIGFTINLSEQELKTFSKSLSRKFSAPVKLNQLDYKETFGFQKNEFGLYNTGLFFNKNKSHVVDKFTSWNKDNFGSIWIPEEGKTIQLTEENIALYFRTIKYHDRRDPESVELINHQVKIDGEIVKEYTFNQNYYFMMGDNRHNSSDSRYFGFVPEDHIVGKPILIWMSMNPYSSGPKKIRWDRLLNIID